VSTRTEFLATLPRKRITAGALIRDDQGRVLLVEPTYKDRWLTPGGTVESGESPAEGAAREVLEELGVPLPIGRPLVMQWRQEEDDPDGVLHFAYDGGVVDAPTIARFRLPPVELHSFRFVEPAEVPTLTSTETAERVDAAIRAEALGTFVELTA
jgi:8-oxo-dGTP diphosphatase